MNIIYRISPFKPDNPAVFYADDKWKLVEMCHKSFLKAGGDKYPTTYIIDSVDWGKIFKDYGEVVEINSHKKVESLLTAYDVASKYDDKVLFVEDDYLWKPDTLPLLDVALDVLPVLSPYDHPGHYTEDRFDHKYEIKLIGNQTYRTCPSNTHTFGLQREVFNQNVERFKKWGVEDHTMFSELNKTAQLWCPIPSFATHLATGCLAPNISWSEVADLYS